MVTPFKKMLEAELAEALPYEIAAKVRSGDCETTLFPTPPEVK